MAIGGPYRAILARPGALAFSLSGVISRFPLSMVGIALILMIESIYGSYALAGRVSAVFVVTQALTGPQIARFIDQYGQSRIMRPLIAVASGWVVALIVAATNQADQWWLYTFAALGGATIGSMGTLVRARWSNLIDDTHELHTAYSLEAALDEVVFVIGPILATYLSTSLFPSAGVIAPLIALLVGGYWFLSQKATEPIPRRKQAPGDNPSVLRFASMIALIGVFIALGGIFGATDVSTIAFATEQGHRESAGLLLSIFALGSLISGLGYGAKHWVMALWKRFVIGMIALAFGASLFVFPGSLTSMGIVMFIAGFAIAPTLINGNNLVQAIVPHHQLTEGLTYVGTSLGVGVSFGATIAGYQIDQGGSHAGYIVVVIAGAFGALMALVSIKSLRKSSRIQP